MAEMMAKNPLRHTADRADALYQYMREVAVRESAALRGLREATAGMDAAGMQISPDQGQFMAMLARLIGAGLIVEVGVFTGYSALAMAQALPPHGRLIACDVSAEWTGVGRPFWEQAGVAERIDLRLAPALETLRQLLDGGYAGRVDMMFIDADKGNYARYYEQGLALLRPNGLLVVDNVFWGGAVVAEDDQSADTAAIRELNQLAAADARVEVAMLAVGDGLLLARKR